MAKSGDTISGWTGLPEAATSGGFSLALAATCALLAPAALDLVNSLLVGAVVLSFLGLLAAAAPGVDLAALGRADWAAVPGSLPTISLAFVFHNVTPVISSQLEGDMRKIRIAITVGVGVPLLMFLAWDAAILGSLGSLQATADGAPADPLAALAAQNVTVGPLIQAFSFLAVTTSFIGFLLGLTDFISELLRLPASQRQLLPYALALGPAFLLQLFAKDLFFAALDVAGTYGVLFLFGVIPSVMVWQERYGNAELLSRTRVVGGGRPIVIGIGSIAAAIIVSESWGSLQTLLHH